MSKDILKRLSLAIHILQGKSLIYKVNLTDTLPIDYDKTRDLRIVEMDVGVTSDELFEQIDMFLGCLK